MQTTTSFYSAKKILMVLALPFFACVSYQASAGDILQTDPSAPCGVLTQVGTDKFIYNNSNFLFTVRFETRSYKPIKSRYLNAGAVKYLELGSHGEGIWRDTGYGNQHTSKSYAVPVGHNELVRIAYCADTSEGEAIIKGTVYFDKVESDGEHNGPQGNVQFSGVRDYDSYENNISFASDGSTTPFVYYNAQPSGNTADGSLAICPKDLNCTVK